MKKTMILMVVKKVIKEGFNGGAVGELRRFCSSMVLICKYRNLRFFV